MKAKLNYLLSFVLFATVGITSCTEDAEITEPTTNLGEETSYINFSFTSQISATKTADPDNAIATEVSLKTIDVYVYDNTKFEKRVPLVLADFTESPAGSNTWVLKDNKKISVVPGAKKVYAGVNIPDEYRTAFAEVDNPLRITTLNALNTTANGFAMFSQEVVATTVAANATASVIIPVDRLLAKVAVHTDSTTYKPANGGGVFSDLKYDVNNNNKVFYLLQKKSGGFVIDPNYDWSATNYTADFMDGTSDLNVDKAPAKYSAYTNVKYTLENTTIYEAGKPGAKLQETSTYAAITTTFTPDSVVDVTTVTTGTLVVGTKDKTFYYAKYEGGEIAYIYAADLAKATTYANSKANGRKVQILTYMNGKAYYTIFLAKSEGYDVKRNHFYVVNINEIKGLGTPTKGDEPKEPIEKDAYLKITVDIQPWSMNTQNVALEN